MKLWQGCKLYQSCGKVVKHITMISEVVNLPTQLLHMYQYQQISFVPVRVCVNSVEMSLRKLEYVCVCVCSCAWYHLFINLLSLKWSALHVS